MEGAKFVIEGGRELEGEIEVKGSKNAALAAMPASLLFSASGGFDEMFQNSPAIEDIKRMRELLFVLESSGEMNVEIAKKFRASILAVGPALARYGKVVFPHPGGCLIGARPIDVFLEGWKKMGAKVKTPTGKTPHGTDIYEITAPRGLKGCNYTLRVPSVTGTEGIIMTAVLAEGSTVIKNAAIEPEVRHLAKFLNQNGAKISGAGTHAVRIEGTGGEFLRFNAPFLAPPDRIEAGSFLILGGLLAKKLAVKNVDREEVASLLVELRRAGVAYEVNGASMIVKKAARLNALNIRTKEYPGFATDYQPLFTVLLTQAEGRSLVNETIWEGRLNYAEDLNKMGASITIQDPNRAVISGPTPLKAKNMQSPDLRAGLAFVIAGLLAEGRAEIANIYQIDRGYERIEERLAGIGADIKRIT